MPKSPVSPASSRNTMMTVGRMPVIAEDDSLPPGGQPPSAPLPPSPPSRSTKPNYYGRSPTPRIISYPPSVHSRRSSLDSSRSSLSTRSLLSSRPSSGSSTPRKGQPQLLPITTPVRPTQDEKIAERERISRRSRWHRLILVAVVTIGLAVGLSVGLTVGSHNQQSPSNTPDAPVPTNLFPAGSFAFNTALVESNTSCTSNPSTWRCYPYQTYSQTSAPGGSGTNASLATFFWTVAAKNSYMYQISSSSNPFAPQFTNLTMSLLDGNSYNERLVFNFSLPKAVVPAEAITTDDRAATCVFPDTAFRATLWTRKKNDEVGVLDGNTTAVSTGAKWAEWPGQVEVVEATKKGGGPECKDVDGKEVQVASGAGECTCRYANFDLESAASAGNG